MRWLIRQWRRLGSWERRNRYRATEPSDDHVAGSLSMGMDKRPGPGAKHGWPMS
jgi:hypothetical protein